MNPQIRELAEQADIKLSNYYQDVKYPRASYSESIVDGWSEETRQSVDLVQTIRISEMTEEKFLKFVELVEKKSEAKYFSEGYIAGQSDGHADAVLLCVDYLISAGANDLAQEIKTQFGKEE